MASKTVSDHAEQVRELLERRDFFNLRLLLAEWTPAELALLIRDLPSEKDVIVFRLVSSRKFTRTFEYLPLSKQQELIGRIIKDRKRLTTLLNDLSPDERTHLLSTLPPKTVERLLGLLSKDEYEIAVQLLSYPEESVGRLMTPDYVAVRPEWTVQDALDYIRQHGHDSETLNVIYVVDGEGRLIDDLRVRQILLAVPDATIAVLMDKRFITLKATDDRESAIHVFHDHGRTALPVTDNRRRLLGIVTVDDILHVSQQEVTEDIQKIGGSEAMITPYTQTALLTLVKKRARWLVFLFLGEMLTATAMGYFEKEIARAVVLALFVPLIISSGGNSGSQAATLIIRAMAIGEITLHDWWRVMRRELLSGFLLGAILASIGFLRITIWEEIFHLYGQYWFFVALTVSFALIGVVLWGTLVGSMLPFVLRKLGADPAASSAPFVATLVDVTGLVIYFSMATLVLGGRLL